VQLEQNVVLKGRYEIKEQISMGEFLFIANNAITQGGGSDFG